MAIIDYYDILKIPSDSNAETIKKAFRREIAIYHPENNSSPGAKESFNLMIEAFDILSNPAKRKAYDHMLEASINQQKHVLLNKEQEKTYQDWRREAKRKSEKSWDTTLTELLLLDLFLDIGFSDIFNSIGDDFGDLIGDVFDIF